MKLGKEAFSNFLRDYFIRGWFGVFLSADWMSNIIRLVPEYIHVILEESILVLVKDI